MSPQLAVRFAHHQVLGPFGSGEVLCSRDPRFD